MKETNNPGAFSRICYKFLFVLVKLVYPKTKIEGIENLPKEASIVVGNHTQMNGPICSEIYFPGNKYIWCAHQMMYLKEVPAYSYKDFWSYKPKLVRPFFKLASYLIAPLSVCVFNNAHTIPVYRDTRVMKTFKTTARRLEEGNKVIVFPECYEPYNNIVNNFEKNFVDVAKLYYKTSGKAVPFVPLYVAPKLKKIYIGKPVYFNPDAPMENERERICDYLKEEITSIAVNLPPHKVVPYANLPKKDYKMNIR